MASHPNATRARALPRPSPVTRHPSPVTRQSPLTTRHSTLRVLSRDVFRVAHGSRSSLCRARTMRAQLENLRALAHESGLPLVAAGDVHMHVRSRRALQDVLTAIRLGVPVRAAGDALYPNGERHLRRRARIAALYDSDLIDAERAHRGTLPVRPRHAALRISRRARARGRNTGKSSAQADRSRPRAPLSRRRNARDTRARRARARADRRARSTSISF